MRSLHVPVIFTLVAAVTAPCAAGTVCETTAEYQRSAASLELREDLYVQIATCFNETNPFDALDCLVDAIAEYAEGREIADAQLEARLDLCDMLGEDAYDPRIDPDAFVEEIDNPYLPFPVGAHWVYTSETEDGFETIDVTVLPETREIMGVECVTVRDVVSIDGVPVEDTLDWYAQDEDGNVWYFGEISFNYEDGFVTDIDGSWLSGVDGAKPGIVMLGDVTAIGRTYRQEWWLGEAEDAGTLLANDVAVRIGDVTYVDCLKTADFLPPEPDALEYKYYAPGIGFIYETKADSDETVELISVTGL